MYYLLHSFKINSEYFLKKILTSALSEKNTKISALSFVLVIITSGVKKDLSLRLYLGTMESDQMQLFLVNKGQK